ncbi:MAG: hypothetical protein JSS68_02110 [Actinobacteria bacterium]|nr:hypothetical protein [Actinomycetota bacterium]
MDPIRKRELKRQAWQRLSAQRRRAGLLRGRVVVISLVCFAFLWGVVFVQMATGNDPVLAPKEAAVRSAAAGARREGQAADAREPEAERRAQRAKARAAEEAGETEPEAEVELVEAEAQAVAPATEEAEPEAEEFVEAEPQVEEVEAEPEPLVTSQS